MTNGPCRSCDAPLDGDYCAHCGQPRPRDDDFSLRRQAAEAWAELSDTDSRLWRSLLGLLVPGRLTRAWLDHDWSRHLPPLRLYLIASGVYFLLAWDVGFQLNAELLRSAPTQAASPGQLPRLGWFNFVYLHVGALGRALEFYEGGVKVGYSVSISNALLWHPSYGALRTTERYKQFMRERGVVEYWRQRGWPDQCRPAGPDDFSCD